MKTTEEIEGYLRQVTLPTDPAVDARILAAAREALRSARSGADAEMPADATTRRWSPSSLWQSMWMRFPLAAAAMIGIVLTMYLWQQDATAPRQDLRPKPGTATDRGADLIGTPSQGDIPGEPLLLPLQIDLPQKKFKGTPAPIRVDYLEAPRRGMRPPFLAPEGTVNLALNRPVTSSDPIPIIGELAQVTDGDKEAIDGSWVELGPDLQWVQIDLGRRCEIFAIVVWHYHADVRVFHDVIVQAGDEPDFAAALTLFNNDHDNSAGLGRGRDLHYVDTYEGKLIDAKGVAARYVRLYSRANTSNDQNYYTEVEVYGRPLGR